MVDNAILFTQWCVPYPNDGCMTQQPHDYYTDSLSDLLDSLQRLDRQIHEIVAPQARNNLLEALQDERRSVLAALITQVLSNVQGQASSIITKPFASLAERQGELRAEFDQHEHVHKHIDAELDALQRDIEQLRMRYVALSAIVLPETTP